MVQKPASEFLHVTAFLSYAIGRFSPVSSPPLTDGSQVAFETIVKAIGGYPKAETSSCKRGSRSIFKIN